jgi:purine-binding chemotaxis protein CheW
MENQIVIFELAGEQFGVAIQAVESIIKMQPITRMPQAPAFVQGITNLRGKILPVIDLRQRFNLPACAASKDSRIVVAAIDGFEMGMLVDNVSEVLTLQEGEIEPTPRLATAVQSDFVTGIARLAGRLVILLNLRAVLSIKEIV